MKLRLPLPSNIGITKAQNDDARMQMGKMSKPNGFNDYEYATFRVRLTVDVKAHRKQPLGGELTRMRRANQQSAAMLRGTSSEMHMYNKYYCISNCLEAMGIYISLHRGTL